MTDKEKIRAEVEMRLSHHLAFSGKFKGFKSMADEDKAILSFIDSLPEELAKFKIGDTIRPKGSKAEYTITSISGGCYHGKGWRLQIDAEKDYELVESAEDVDAQIKSQNEAIKQLNSALNSMEHGGHLPLVENNMISDKYIYGKEPEIVDIDDLPLDACNIQYASIDGAIKAHAEDYSFNIESELFQQLTPEQQEMWRKEIEQAVISGGYSGLNLAKDRRYDDTPEVKEEQEDPVSEVWHNASEEPNDMSHCLIYYGCKEFVGHYLHYESVLYNKKEKVFVTPSFPHPTGYKVEQKSIDGGCVAEVYKDKRDRILISDITQWCYLKDLHNFSNVQRTVKNWKEEPVRGDFEMALAEMIDKAQKCVVEPWVVAAQWKDELLRLAKECKATQEHPKDCMYSKDNYTDEDRKILCEDCEEDCKYNKKEEPASDGMEKELPKVWDRETLDEYAYQVAYDLSNDWMRETPTWDDVETACKLGAGWKEKHMIEFGMQVSSKAQKGE